MNKRTKLFIIIFIFQLTVTLNAQVKIAVIDFLAKGVSETDASILTDRFRNILVNVDSLKVYEREILDELIAEQGLQLSELIADESIVELGKIIGVEQIISGSVSSIGKTYSVTAKIIDVKTGEILNSSSIDFQGKLDELLSKGMNRLASQLLGESQEVKNVFLSQTIENSHSLADKPALFQASLLYPIQLFKESNSVTGLRINILYGRIQSVYGIDLGVVNWVTQDMYGIQCGVINHAHTVQGIQGGLINISKKVKGIQVGLVNTTDTMFGIQIGLFNTIHSSSFPFIPIINAGISF